MDGLSYHARRIDVVTGTTKWHAWTAVFRSLRCRSSNIYRGKDAIYAMIGEMEDRDGCTIYDPHVVTIEDGGMKEIDTAQIDFKKLADPHGLMNPGKTRGWTADMAVRSYSPDDPDDRCSLSAAYPAGSD